jgi:hypothetical protein
MIVNPLVAKNSSQNAVLYDLSEGYDITFRILYREEAVFKRDKANGKVLRIGKSEIEIATAFPLKVSQVLYWADRHKKDALHVATVKWSKKSDDTYRAGLSVLS